jgi:hypothetical protein
LAAPQAWHRFERHTVCPVQAGPVVQQAWPAFPQVADAWQVPLTHVAPDAHVVPSQQTEPAAPQQKPRESQVGAWPHMVLDVHAGKQTGTPDVPAFASQT